MRTKHGGKRKNAGRKAKDAAKGLSRYSVYLDRDTSIEARNLGKGNLSLGIRRAFRQLPCHG